MLNKSAKVLKYEAVFEENDGGGYTVTVPSLPGCISEGDTFEGATINIKDAIKLYIEDLRADNKEVPSSETSTFVGQVSVAF